MAPLIFWILLAFSKIDKGSWNASVIKNNLFHTALLLQWFISCGLFVYGQWLFQLLDGSFGNGYSHGYLFKMVNSLFGNGNQL